MVGLLVVISVLSDKCQGDNNRRTTSLRNKMEPQEIQRHGNYMFALYQVYFAVCHLSSSWSYFLFFKNSTTLRYDLYTTKCIPVCVQFDEFGQMCIPTATWSSIQNIPSAKSALLHSTPTLTHPSDFQPYQLVLSVLELHINGIVQNMLFSCFFLSTRSWAPATVYQQSLPLRWWVVFNRINIPQAVCSPVEEHTNYFQLLVVIIKQQGTFVYRPFSWVNAQEQNS